MIVDDFLVRKLAFGIAAVGLVLIVFINNSIEAKLLGIEEISEENLGEKILTQGRVTWAKKTEKALLFVIEDFESIDCVIFNPSVEQALAVERNAEVFVWGKVEKYNKKLEIIVERIERLG